MFRQTLACCCCATGGSIQTCKCKNDLEWSGGAALPPLVNCVWSLQQQLELQQRTRETRPRNQSGDDTGSVSMRGLRVIIWRGCKVATGTGPCSATAFALAGRPRDAPRLAQTISAPIWHRASPEMRANKWRLPFLPLVTAHHRPEVALFRLLSSSGQVERRLVDWRK